MLTWKISFDLKKYYHPKSDLMHLFKSGVARRVSVTLLSIFSPIFIFKLLTGLGFSMIASIVLVLIYFLILFIFKIGTMIISEDLSRKIGFKTTIWLSAVPFLLFLPTIINSAKYPFLLIFAAAFWGMHAGLYWWGYHGYFVKTGDIKHFGEGIGEANLLETIASVITPIGGAFIASYFGFNFLFIFSGLWMILSLVFLGREHDKKQRRDIDIKEVMRLIIKHKTVSLAYMGLNAEYFLYGTMWPLYIFLFFGKVLSTGAIISLASLIAALFSIGIGRLSDKRKDRTVISLGSPLIALSWFFRTLTKHVPMLILADSIENFGQIMVKVPLNALSYKKAVEAESAKAILFRETAMTIGSVIAIVILISWLFIGALVEKEFLLNESFQAVGFIAAASSLLPLIAIYRHRI